jgi:CRP-like cAMP-binding protein
MSSDEVDFSLLLRPEVPTRNFATGDTIFSEGEKGDEFFVVVRGKVEIRSATVASKLWARRAFSAKWR